MNLLRFQLGEQTETIQSLKETNRRITIENETLVTKLDKFKKQIENMI